MFFFIPSLVTKVLELRRDILEYSKITCTVQGIGVFDICFIIQFLNQLKMDENLMLLVFHSAKSELKLSFGLTGKFYSYFMLPTISYNVLANLLIFILNEFSRYFIFIKAKFGSLPLYMKRYNKKSEIGQLLTLYLKFQSLQTFFILVVSKCPLAVDLES